MRLRKRLLKVKNIAVEQVNNVAVKKVKEIAINERDRFRHFLYVRVVNEPQ